jgi:hypothetical protein
MPASRLTVVEHSATPRAPASIREKASEPTRFPEEPIRRALRVIRKCKPGVVCFIGKIAFNKFYGSRKCDWSRQTPIDGVPVYLMHFPIRGPAVVRVRELQAMKRASSVRAIS